MEHEILISGIGADLSRITGRAVVQVCTPETALARTLPGVETSRCTWLTGTNADVELLNNTHISIFLIDSYYHL